METIAAFDFETWLIRPGLLAPPPVCMTFQEAVALDRAHTRSPAGILQAHLHPDDVASMLWGWLRNPDTTLVGANTAYDVAVSMARWPELVRPWFDRYDAGRVVDVQIAQMLVDNARGQLGGYARAEGKGVKHGYSLADLEKRHFNRDRYADKSGDASWRLRYSELAEWPLELWPSEALRYALEDAEGTLDVMLELLWTSGRLLSDLPAQTRAALDLHLKSCWGVHTDPVRIEAFRQETVSRFEALSLALQAQGLVRKDGTRDTKQAKKRMQAACEKEGVAVPVTDKGLKLMEEQGGVLTDEQRDTYISLDALSCEDSGDELLEEYAERTSLQTVVSSHIPALLCGVNEPIQARFNVLVSSGRTSCSFGRPKPGPVSTHGYQLQNPKRKGEVRKCFIARDGYVFIDTDIGGLELHTVAQVLLRIVGWSRLAEALNAGKDPHLMMASGLLNIAYEDAVARKHEPEVKKAREACKPGNFGFAGRMGPKAFVKYARKSYGVRLGATYEESLAKAIKIRAIWIESFPEFELYFDHIGGLCDNPSGVAHVVQLVSGRERGLVAYTEACNTFFQGLGADAAKRGSYLVTRACYAEPDSVLYQNHTRPWNFVHDQVLSETLEGPLMHEAAVEQARVFVAGVNEYLPDVPAKCEPVLTRAWQKAAEGMYGADGRLIVYEDAVRDRPNCTYKDGKQVVW